MIRHRFLVPHLVTLFVMAVPSGLAAADHDHSLEFGGLTRSYKVHTPPSYDGATPLPVMIVLHGGGGHADDFIQWLKMNDTADGAGFIAVHPNGSPAGGAAIPGARQQLCVWNAGTCCPPAEGEPADDVGFIRAMLDELAESYAIDKRRVYATGASNGAMMAYSLASQLSDRIAAIAPVACAMGFENIEATRPVSVLHIHGTEDMNAPIAGGVGSNARAKFVQMPLRKCIAKWVEHNGCPPEPVVEELPDREDDGTRVRRETYGPGKGGAEVILYLVEGGGHTWPGAPDLADKYLARTKIRSIEPDPWYLEFFRRCGRASREISANDVIWEFFSRHSLEE
jgi:polyhydroxybutyrate depolymerase